MNVVGIDLSLTGTGIADDKGCTRIGFSLTKTATWQQRAARLRKLGVAIDIATQGADLVVIESPAYNQSNSGHALGELHGVVKVVLLQRGREAIFISAQQLKQFACDHGNAGKDAVLAAAIRDGSPATNFDEADAWWLRRMGLYAYRPDLRAALPKYRQKVLDGIRWPSIEERQVAVG